ncbi:DUF4259 domain-containing protein [Dactylosporangium sucinum]|uniref:Uncharacterized protein n=1 Tax=Dactylosporangium sucinum TaxID=1424081 RepID=A0A917X6D7_9ACTN|nr:DUF4259 domain-containing protein [Dactylosporangium sucinum]GGM86380.1 hypothetical protein GCM10007977_105340 [Dactylosporangium sucinum]
MRTFGTGTFSSDGAIDFLERFAERSPERRVAALEHMFLLVKEKPELLWREFLPDEVVAAAAIVAASLPGGRLFDVASDVRLTAPAPRLAGIALEALHLVAGPQGPWHQRWTNDTDAAEARDTIAALSQVLTLGGGAWDDPDITIWIEAADYGADGEVPEGTPPGIEHLASLLRVYNSAMGGGLGFALEVNEPFRVRRAINAMRYFGLAEPADLLEDALSRSLNGEPPDSWPSGIHDRLDGLLDDKWFMRAFKAKAAEVPTDFGRE